MSSRSLRRIGLLFGLLSALPLTATRAQSGSIQFIQSPTLAPNPFAPPGQTSVLSVDLSVQAPPGLIGSSSSPWTYFVQLSWTILQGSGSPVQITTTQQVQAPSPQTAAQTQNIPLHLTLGWNGRDAAGTLVADAAYTYQVQATLTRIHKTQQQPEIVSQTDVRTGSVTVSTPAPTLTLTQPADHAITKIPSITVAGTFTVSRSPAVITVQGQPVVPTGNSFETLVTLAEGDNTLTARVTDAMGRFAEQSRTVTLDTHPPQVVISSPANGASINDSTPLLEGHLQDPAPSSALDLPSLVVQLDGQNVTAQFQIADGTISWTPADPLAEGPHSLTVSVKDRAGNEGSTTVSFVVDTVPPVIALVPETGTVLTENTLTLLANYVDPGPGSGLVLSSLEALLDEQDVTASFVADPVQARFEIPPTAPLADGEHVFTFRISDAAGNSTTSSSHFLIDTVRPPTVTLTADPASISDGQTAALTWQSTFADTAQIEPEIGSVATSGSLSVTPRETTTYRITVTGPKGTATAEATVTVEGSGPTVQITASPAHVQAGSTATLTWTSSGATEAFIDNGVGAVAPEGSITVTVAHTTEYTITVSGPTGTGTAKVVVSVIGNPMDPPNGTFGSRYTGLIPPDSTVLAYDPDRFALITGHIQDASGAPVLDAAVQVVGHPEYGTAHTDAAGQFSIPVDGGQDMTVSIQKDPFIGAQRSVYVPWNDIAVLDPTRLVERETTSTAITFDGNPSTVFVHRNVGITDALGQRSVTLVFTGDNTAYSVDAAGQDIASLPSISVRATEFPTPETMPAKLPPTSAFTYCAELSADGVDRIRFTKPVTVWVNNFLQFPIGVPVPVGYYDRDQGRWVASRDGRVVQLLDTNGDTQVDALDADGDGLPDDLNLDSSFSDEVRGLTDAQVYAANATFWRAELSHFTPVDLNLPLGIPSGAILPVPPQPATVQQKHEECLTCPERVNSSLDARSQVIEEDIPIAGTGMVLHYSSARTKGYKPTISVPASGPSIPSVLRRILVTCDVAGHHLERNLPAQPNQDADFVWDGTDHLGNIVDAATARIAIGFVYDTPYSRPRDSSAWATGSFSFPGVDPLAVQTRTETILWNYQRIRVAHTTPTSPAFLAEGWTLSPVHYVDFERYELQKGDGSILRKDVGIIDSIAGTGSSGFSGDGGDAKNATLNSPQGLATDGAGNIYVSDRGNRCIRKIDRSGIIQTIAGLGPTTDPNPAACEGLIGDGGPANQAPLCGPSDLATDAQGNLFFREFRNVRKIDVHGILTTCAGNGEGCSLNDLDGAPATSVGLCDPFDIATDRSGNLYISERSHPMIRKVDTSGFITRVAGTGDFGASAGDGGPAINARFAAINGISVDYDGNIYVCDTFSSGRIRKINNAGIITTVAGGGTLSLVEGRVATQANLGNLLSVKADPFGGGLFFYGTALVNFFSQPGLFRVTPDGRIRVVVPIGSGSSGNGGPAILAKVIQSRQLTVDVAGNLLMTDILTNTIRKIELPLFPLAGQGPGEIGFADPAGVGHIFSQAGQHKRTVDLLTGKPLLHLDYDSQGRLSRLIDARDQVVTIQRDANGVPTAIISPDQVVTGLSIDSSGRLTKVSHPGSREHLFGYQDGVLSLTIDPKGNRFERDVDPSGRITQARNEEGGSWTFSSDAQTDGSVLSSMTTAEGNVTTYRDLTDHLGNISSTITAPDSSATLFSKPGNALSSTKTIPCGLRIDEFYSLDSKYKSLFTSETRETQTSGRRRTITSAHSYTDANNDGIPELATATTSLNGKTTTVRINTTDHTTTVTTPVGRIATTYFDANRFFPTRLTASGFPDLIYGHDARGRVTSATVGDRTASLTYNTDGTIASSTDPANRVTRFSYSPARLLSEVRLPDQQTILIEHDANGAVSRTTTPNHTHHDFTYSKTNTLTSYRTHTGKSYSYTYDRDRRPTSTTLPSGRKIELVYNGARLESVTSPEDTIAISYVCASNIGTLSRGQETVSYSYDGSLITNVSQQGTLSKSLAYTYNNDFRVTSMVYAGATCAFAYNNDGLVTQVGSAVLTRNAQSGLPVSVTDGTVTRTATYNGFGEPETLTISVAGIQVGQLYLLRDKLSRIETRRENIGGVISEYLYTYDALGRLDSVRLNGTVVEDHEYDAGGRRTAEINTLRGIGQRTFNYNDDDQVTSAGDETFTWHVDGFLQTRATPTLGYGFTYTARGELRYVTRSDGMLIEYVTDPLGRRIAKKVNGVITEKYLWAGRTGLLAVFNGQDQLLARFEGSKVVLGGTTYHIITDQVGSVRALVNASGNIVRTVTRDAFGNIISDTNPTLNCYLGFAGGLEDRDTGLVLFGFRDYLPDIGRWTARDPIGLAGGDLDLYAYCGQDPANGRDPTGLFLPALLLTPIAASTFWSASAAAGALIFGGFAAMRGGDASEVLVTAGAGTVAGLGVAAGVAVSPAVGAGSLYASQRAGAYLAANNPGLFGLLAGVGLTGQACSDSGKLFQPEEVHLLQNFFGTGPAGAWSRLNNLSVPEGITTGLLLRYRDVALTAIANNRDRMGARRQLHVCNGDNYTCASQPGS